ncbi:hypothetical protein [Maridesulfovibrio ferrireducens]|uniref:hypothetical protein n=1 Tax=Maridesulfovibrio ferrireducens TaxID=246191 RepID=UPI001A2B5383|nr:hypothetical protein [Maridesulfovibrio ferrireducens]MBI9109968.1 hypothetical protein [Maridesulfovibrio ferrireducens]
MVDFEDLDGQDFWKVIGGAAAGVGVIAAIPLFGAVGTVSGMGAILGSTLGIGAGLAVATEDAEDRESIRENISAQKEEEWNDSINARKSLVACASSMQAYQNSVKMAYALVASCFSNTDSEANSGEAMLQMNSLFATWLPEELNDELKLIFQKVPTFYEVAIMMKNGFKSESLDAAKFIYAMNSILSSLETQNMINLRHIEADWNIFKTQFVNVSDSEATKEKMGGFKNTAKSEDLPPFSSFVGEPNPV